MANLPTITALDIINRLVEDQIVTPEGLVSLLGKDRHTVTLNVLEMALVRANILSADNLTRIKSEISGRPAYLDSSIGVTDFLDKSASSTFGAIVLDRQPLTVAMVEDTPANVSGVAAALGNQNFEIWFITASDYALLREAAYSGRKLDRLPVAEDLAQILDIALAERASDVHIMAGVPPRLRVDGRLRELDFQPVDRGWVWDQVRSVCEPRHLDELAAEFSTDLAYTFGSFRFRVNIAMDINGYTMAMRQMPSTIPTPDEIDLPEVIRSFAHLEAGIVLVTGPTGSGKSTTLAAMLNEVVLTSRRHIITLEDPVEFRFSTRHAAQVNQRELGQSFDSFSAGLRDALRQDPDVILVGELRDMETIRTAVTAAETGHLVLGSLHTYDAASTIARMTNAVPANEQDAMRAQLATLLQGVVSQTLLPRAGGKGRIAAHEVLVNTTAIRANLRKPDGHSQLRQTMQTGLADGMTTMEASLARLVVTGQVTRADAEFRARDMADFQRMLDYYSNQVSKARLK